MAEMRVMGRRGDDRFSYDSSNKEELANAKHFFEEKRKMGMVAFAITPEGGTGTMLKEFDPKAERIVFVPAMAGGL